jgi:hypothetical protein
LPICRWGLLLFFWGNRIRIQCPGSHWRVTSRYVIFKRIGCCGFGGIIGLGEWDHCNRAGCFSWEGLASWSWNFIVCRWMFCWEGVRGFWEVGGEVWLYVFLSSCWGCWVSLSF